MATSLGRLNVLIGADMKELENALATTQKRLKNAGAAFKKFAVPAGAALAAVGAAAIGAAVKVGNMADELLDLEQMTGLTTDQLQEFRRVATVAGVGPDTIAEAAQRLTTRLRAAGTDTATFVDNMKELGVSSKDAAGDLRSMDELLPEIITALQNTEDITKRNALAAQIFGRSYQTLAPILGLTTDQFEAARQEAHDLGLVVGRDALNAANEFRIKWQTLRDQLGGAAVQIGVSLIPTFTRLVDFITEKVVPAIVKFTDHVGITNTKLDEFRRGLDDLTVGQLQSELLKADAAIRNTEAELAKVQERSVKAFLFGFDLSKQKELNELLRQQEEEYEAIFKQLHNVVRAQQEGAESPPVIDPETTNAAKVGVLDLSNALSGVVVPALRETQDALAGVNAEFGPDSNIFKNAPILAEALGASLKDKVIPPLTELQKLGIRTFDSFTNAIVDFASGAKGAFTDFVKSAIRGLAQLIVKALALKAIMILIPGAGGVLGSVFGGFFAQGGTLRPGQFGVVGERGPELVFAGAAGATVEPISGGLTLSVDVSGLPPAPRAVSPDALAVDDWWRRAFSALVADGRERGVQFT